MSSIKPVNKGGVKSKIICKYFMLGKCNKGENCPYLHSQIEKPKEMTQVECPMYSIGFCKNGPCCHFLHIKKDKFMDEEFEEKNTTSTTPNAEEHINNYINNNININLINNNYLDSRLNHSFLNNNILKNNLNINLNSVRMSYQKKENRFLVKSNKRSCVKKSFSAKVRTLKEKYRNSLNYYLHTNPTNKLCEDEDESCVSSDKESENTDSNLFLTPKVVAKKKNSKISEITPIKEDIFSKAMIAFLMEENNDRNNNKNHSSTHYKNIKKISKAEIEAPRNAEIIRNRGKRSSLCPRMNYQFKNKNRHVTFTQRKSDKDSITKNISKFDEDLKTHKFSINNHNIRRIKFNDDK